jgi:hypothetical protein
MPGLIGSKEYAAAKAALIDSTPGADEAVDAIEWGLLNTAIADLRHFPIVHLHDVAKRDEPPCRSIMAGPSYGRPSLVAVFTTEFFDGEDKILLLDVWLNLDSQGEEDIESEDTEDVA